MEQKQIASPQTSPNSTSFVEVLQQQNSGEAQANESFIQSENSAQDAVQQDQNGKRLEEEINLINQLFDSIVEISTGDAEKTHGSSLNIITLSCTYTANGISPDWSPTKPQPFTIYLAVPPTYPKSPPEVNFKESTPPENHPCFMRAWEEFGLWLRYTQATPSITTIALTWNSCVRNVLNQFRERLDGEINGINNQLFGTIVEISTGDVEKTHPLSHDRIMLSCTYKADGILPDSSSLKPQPFTLYFAVPPTYPESPPEIEFKRSTPQANQPCFEGAREEFVRWFSGMHVPGPSITAIASNWNSCARKALLKYARQQGGGDFTTTIGSRETT